MQQLITAIDRRAVLAVTIALGVLFSAGIASIVRSQEAARHDSVITRHVAIVDARVSTLMGGAVSTLESIRPLWALRDDPERQDFAEYLGEGIAETDATGEVTYNGLSTVAFIRSVRPGQATDFLTRRRAENPGTGWYAQDLDDASPHYVVDFHSANDITGVDVYPLDSRRIALDKARDSGRAVATDWYVTVSDLDKPKQQQRKILVVAVPVYDGGQVPATITARRAEITGWLASAVFADDMVRALREDLSTDIALYEGVGAARTLASTSSPDGPTPDPSTTMIVDPFGHEWTVELALSRAALPSTWLGPWAVLAAGLLMTTLLSAILWLTARRGDDDRRRAVNTATLLAQSDESLHFVAEQVPVGICELDADGSLRWMNDRAHTLVGNGNANDAASGDGASDGGGIDALVHPDDRQTVNAAITDAIATGEVFTVRHRVPVDGETRWAELSGAAIKHDDGRVDRLMVVVADMTEIVATERGLIDARDQALEASKLKSQFLANMSHEIRTPLNGVIGMSDVLFAGELSPPQRSRVTTLRTAAVQLKELLDDILDLSKIEAGKVTVEKVSFGLASAITGVARLYVSEANNRQTPLRLELDPQLPALVRGPKLRLRQVLDNLVGNAVKFTPEGQITLSTELVERSEDRAVLRFSVADTGIGVPAGDLATIFEPFTQVDGSSTRQFGGTGLGLAISRELVELGGQLTVSSVEGEGSTFRFEIPLEVRRWTDATPDGNATDATDDESLATTDGGATSHRVTTAAPDPARRHGGDRQDDRILVVEDNAINRQVAFEMLTALGYTIDMAEGGEQGVDASGEVAYGAILMDCQMPGMDGYEATRLIRMREADEGGRTPIIAMTASAMSGDRERCLAVGMDDYLSKPVSMQALHTTLRRWTGENAPSTQPAVAAATDEDVLIDWETLHHLAAVPGLMQRSLELFQRKGGSEIVALDALIDEHALDAAAALAHKVKGAAATVGAQRLARALARLERACRDAESDNAVLLVGVVESAFRDSVEAYVAAGSVSDETPAPA